MFVFHFSFHFKQRMLTDVFQNEIDCLSHVRDPLNPVYDLVKTRPKKKLYLYMWKKVSA